MRGPDSRLPTVPQLTLVIPPECHGTSWGTTSVLLGRSAVTEQCSRQVGARYVCTEGAGAPSLFVTCQQFLGVRKVGLHRGRAASEEGLKQRTGLTSRSVQYPGHSPSHVLHPQLHVSCNCCVHEMGAKATQVCTQDQRKQWTPRTCFWMHNERCQSNCCSPHTH